MAAWLNSGTRGWAWGLFAAFLAAFAGAWYYGGPGIAPAPHLRAGLNFLFTTVAGGTVACLFARAFMARGSFGVLLLGCGALIWGAAGTVAIETSLIASPEFDVNLAVTIHNICVWAASVCQLSGAAILTGAPVPLKSRVRWLAGAYILAAGAVVLIAAAAFSKWTPFFFDAVRGATITRTFVLGCTVATVLLTLLVLKVWRRGQPAFLYWFGHSQLLLAAAYTGLTLGAAIHNTLGLAVYAAQYTAGVYMFIAALTALRGDRAQVLVPLQASPENAPHRYSIAVATVLAATVIWLVFFQQMGTQAPLLAFYPAVMLAALYGGLLPGALTTAASLLLANYFWIPQLDPLGISNTEDRLAAAVFVPTCLFLSAVAGRLREATAAMRRAETARREQLEHLVAERTAELSREVSIRRRAEETARENEARFRAAEAKLRLAIESAPAAIAMFDRNMRYLAVSRRYAEDYKIDFNIVAGRSHYDVLPDTPERWREIHRRCLEGATERCAEDPFPRGDGTVEWVSWEIVPWHDANGGVGGIVLFSENITWRREAENGLRAAKAEAERAVLAKSKFLAAASHDLRQPVQSLVLLLDVLKNQASTPPVSRALDAMEAALDGLNRLLTGILDISRIDAGVVTPQIQSVDLGEMTQRVCAAYTAQCNAKGLRLRCRAKPGLFGRTSAAQAERILSNLIENAIRYTARGGVLVATRRQGGRVRIDVIDTGGGIPENKLPLIFEEFYQAGNPARDYKQGLGLGLAIVRRLAGLTGAEVRVRSREGRGTCFTVLMPMEAASDSTAPAGDAGPEAVTGRRIMVIEDNPKVRIGLQLLLESWRCQVVSAETGEDAIRAGEENGWRFDAIIADHRLGAGLTGTRAAAEIRKRSGMPIPAIIVTGDTAPERIEEVHASGFEMLHKPVSPRELARTMARLLEPDAKTAA